MDNYFIIKKKENIKPKKIDTSLLIKNHIPLWFKEFELNKNVSNKLNNIVNETPNIQKNIMNLFIYGRSGKYTMAKTYINEYIEENSYDIKLSIFTSTNGKELEYYRGKYHYELILNKYNFTDFNLIKEFMSLIVKKDNSYFSIKQNIILIKNIQFLKLEFYSLVKYYVEQFSEFNKFIFISSNNIVKNFKGLFVNISIKKNNEKELEQFSKNLLLKVNVDEDNILNDDIESIVKQSEGNIGKLKNLLEYCYLTGTYEEFPDCDLDKIKFLYKLILKGKLECLIIIRDILNNLLVENVSSKFIIKTLIILFIKETKKKFINKNKKDIIHNLVECEKNVNTGLRDLHHLEYSIIKIMNLV